MSPIRATPDLSELHPAMLNLLILFQNLVRKYSYSRMCMQVNYI
jgi:hypothetical protein